MPTCIDPVAYSRPKNVRAALAFNETTVVILEIGDTMRATCTGLETKDRNGVNKSVSSNLVVVLTDPKRMPSAELMTASITLDSFPAGAIAVGAAERANSISVGRENKGYSQSERCEDCVEVHDKLDL